MQRSKLLFLVPAAAVCITGYYGIAFGRLVVNATSSLDGNAYAMVTWPKILRHDSIVSLELPEVLQRKFSSDYLVLTKRIVGLEGDPVSRDGNTICIRETCVEGQLKGGELVAPLWDADRVPAGTVAVFGDSTDSLDSRYAVIGPRPVDEVIAVGFEIPFPHWTQLAERWK